MRKVPAAAPIVLERFFRGTVVREGDVSKPRTGVRRHPLVRTNCLHFPSRPLRYELSFVPLLADLPHPPSPALRRLLSTRSRHALLKPTDRPASNNPDLHRAITNPARLPAVVARDRRRGGLSSLHRPRAPHTSIARLPAPLSTKPRRHRVRYDHPSGRPAPTAVPWSMSRWWATWPPAPPCCRRRTSRMSCRGRRTSP